MADISDMSVSEIVGGEPNDLLFWLRQRSVSSGEPSQEQALMWKAHEEIRRLRAALHDVANASLTPGLACRLIWEALGEQPADSDAYNNAVLGRVIARCPVCEHVWYSDEQIGKACPYIGCNGTVRREESGGSKPNG